MNVEEFKKIYIEKLAQAILNVNYDFFMWITDCALGKGHEHVLMSKEFSSLDKQQQQNYLDIATHSYEKMALDANASYFNALSIFIEEKALRTLENPKYEDGTHAQN